MNHPHPHPLELGHEDLTAFEARVEASESLLRARARRRQARRETRARRRADLLGLALGLPIVAACVYLAAGGPAFPH